MLGTRGLKATVDAAFEDALRRAAWQRLLDRHRAGAIELTNEEVERLNTRDLIVASAGRRVVSEPSPHKPHLHIGYSRQNQCFYASVWGGQKPIDGCPTLADVERALRAGRYPEPTISTLALAKAGIEVANSPYRIRRKSRE